MEKGGRMLGKRFKETEFGPRKNTKAGLARNHPESRSLVLSQGAFPLLETCPCDLVNLIFLRLVTKLSPEEDPRVCVGEAGSCAV